MVRTKTAQNPGYWQEGDRKWYYQKASSGAGPWYFFPVKKLKNGGLSGLMVDESMDRKAKKKTVSRVEFRDWKQVPDSDVPAKVRSTVFSDGWAKKATDGQLRKSLIRLAAQREDLRLHILPLLSEKTAVDFQSPRFQNRILQEVKKYAGGEPVEVYRVHDDGTWVVTTTELGMYRIWDKYTTGGKNPRAAAKGHSPNIGWFVRTLR